MFGSKLTRANQRAGVGKGRVLVVKQVVECRGRFHRAGVNDYTVSDGFLLSFSMCKRGFHDLLKFRLSFLLMSCGFISMCKPYVSAFSAETSALNAQTPGDYPKKTTMRHVI